MQKFVASCLILRRQSGSHHMGRTDALTHLRAFERGIALVVSLILLILITILGLVAIRGTTVQQRMTANFYDRELAFQNAEAALRAGQALLAAGITADDYRACDGSAGTPCPANPFSDSSLDNALITAPAFRDPALLAKLDAVAGRVLRG